MPDKIKYVIRAFFVVKELGKGRADAGGGTAPPKASVAKLPVPLLRLKLNRRSFVLEEVIAQAAPAVAV
jgi:hypothetical protein